MSEFSTNMNPSDSPDHPGSILYHSESSEVPYSTNCSWSGTFFAVPYSKPALKMNTYLLMRQKKMMSSRGIEPVTFALLARRSNQLS